MIERDGAMRRQGRCWPVVTLALLIASCNGPTGPSGSTLTVTGIAPSSGGTSGGTVVTVTGTGFAAGATVSIGGVAASQVNVTGSTSLTAVAGARAAGTVDVTVTVSGSTATLSGAYTYVAAGSSNAPPTIQSLTARGSRPNQPAAFADLGEALTVTATVLDPETPLTSLVYEWSAAAGTFEGSGASVVWQAPQSLPTPAVVVLTLTAVERYTTDAVQHEHRVSATIAIRVHDSAREVGDMARKFLLLFSDSSVAPELVVQDFFPGCGTGGTGRDDELAQVYENRAEVTIQQYNIGPAAVTVNFGGICAFRNRAGDACVQVPVEWRDVEKGTGLAGHTFGTEHLTAIYSGERWGLCDAEIDATHVRGAVQLPFSRFYR